MIAPPPSLSKIQVLGFLLKNKAVFLNASFYRVNSDRARKTGDTRLGLAIAQTIVQRDQGQLSLDSEIGQDSLFTVSLACIHA